MTTVRKALVVLAETLVLLVLMWGLPLYTFLFGPAVNGR